MARFPAEEINTARLVLRKHQLTDATKMFAAIELARNRLALWLPWVSKTMSPADSLRNIEVCLVDWGLGAMFDYGFYTQTGELVGRGGLHSINWAVPKGEFGYWASELGLGRGYISEAISALETEFFKLGFERLEIRCDPLNLKSAALPQRLGYRLEGVPVNEARHNGKLRDTMVWAKLKA